MTGAEKQAFAAIALILIIVYYAAYVGITHYYSSPETIQEEV
jgi:hypothetical protein